MAMSAEDHVSKAPIWYLVHICLAGSVYWSTSSQVAISRYKVAMVVDKRESAPDDLHTRKVGVAAAIKSKMQILTDEGTPKTRPERSHLIHAQER